MTPDFRRFRLFSDEDFASDVLAGEPPFLDTFASDIMLSRITFPDSIKKWIKSISVVPAFIFYINKSIHYFYRAHGCHSLVFSPHTKDVFPAMIHFALAHYDFLVSFMSSNFTYRKEFYESYPAMITFSQVREGMLPPKGNKAFIYKGKIYLYLFHHTTKERKSHILNEKILKSSAWNFCGTRKLKRKHVYMTDIPKVETKYYTLPLLMRQSEEFSILRTDDEKIIIPPIQFDDRILDERICLLVAPDIIQPNPMIMHMEINKQPKWLEIEFPHIYRCPCSYIRLKKSIVIDNELFWIIECDDVEDFRVNDPICCADGNSSQALLNLINDCYLE